MTNEEIFQRFAKRRELPFVELELEPEAPNQLCLMLNGENGNYEGHALFLEEDQFVFYALLGVRVPAKQMEALSVYLMKLNYRLKYGSFFIEERTGELTVRVVQYLAGADWEREELLEKLIRDCGRTADYYYPEIMKFLFS